MKPIRFVIILIAIFAAGTPAIAQTAKDKAPPSAEKAGDLSASAIFGWFREVVELLRKIESNTATTNAILLRIEQKTGSAAPLPPTTVSFDPARVCGKAPIGCGNTAAQYCKGLGYSKGHSTGTKQEDREHIEFGQRFTRVDVLTQVTCSN
ncbi:hypothetical protein [Bradyrhizobium sp. CCGE-LA001]|uniref:hypothetical protein n=1 Tax=Bradyrhizobium sp. CCGE-LA001 TaxID=1223566 RepID=UPI00119829D5|nr:hypothetical protein [Bradyrhizobium sp. CCGE-LA001]